MATPVPLVACASWTGTGTLTLPAVIPRSAREDGVLQRGELWLGLVGYAQRWPVF